jgi:hypothetical protein
MSKLQVSVNIFEIWVKFHGQGHRIKHLSAQN